MGGGGSIAFNCRNAQCYPLSRRKGNKIIVHDLCDNDEGHPMRRET